MYPIRENNKNNRINNKNQHKLVSCAISNLRNVYLFLNFCDITISGGCKLLEVSKRYFSRALHHTRKIENPVVDHSATREASATLLVVPGTSQMHGDRSVVEPVACFLHCAATRQTARTYRL